MERQLSLRSTPLRATAAAPACLRRSVRVGALQVQLRYKQLWCPQQSTSVLISLQECVVRQVEARQAARRAAGGSQTSTTSSDTWSSSSSSSDEESESGDSDSEATSGGRSQRTRRVSMQQQSAGRRQQHAVGASGPDSGPIAAAAAAAAAGPEGPVTPAVSGQHAAGFSDQGLHQPYSHFFWGHSLLKRGNRLFIPAPLCTNIQEVHSADGTCAAQLYFKQQPAGWDVSEYILQHPVMQAAQPSGPAVGSTSSIQVLGPIEATIKHIADRGLVCQGVSIVSIPRSLTSDGGPCALILFERVRCPVCVLGVD